jgi:hypothetical protein
LPTSPSHGKRSIPLVALSRLAQLPAMNGV